MIQIILFPPHSFSSLPDEIKGLELFFCRVVSPFSLHFLERQAYLCWRHKCLFVVFTVHPLLWDLNYGVIHFTVQKVLSSCLEKPYLFADILVLCVTWIQQLLNFRLCSREVSRSQCGGKRKQLKLSVSYNSVAGITRVGDSCLVFFNLLPLMTLCSYFYVLTLGYFYSYLFDYNTYFVWLLNSLWCFWHKDVSWKNYISQKWHHSLRRADLWKLTIT